MRIAIIGCGFLGSVFAGEFARRTRALDITPTFELWDDDKVSARNLVNQNFRPEFEGRYKVLAVAKDLKAMLPGTDVLPVKKRLTPETIGRLLVRKPSMIVDSVDHTPTRQLLWGVAHAQRIPVLHLGISRAGTGAVEWTAPREVGRTEAGDIIEEMMDTFSLSPLHIKIHEAEPELAELKPCELIGHRRTGLLVGHAGAEAATLAHGFDPDEQYGGRPLYTTWAVGGDALRLTERIER